MKYIDTSFLIYKYSHFNSFRTSNKIVSMMLHFLWSLLFRSSCRCVSSSYIVSVVYIWHGNSQNSWKFHVEIHYTLIERFSVLVNQNLTNSILLFNYARKGYLERIIFNFFYMHDIVCSRFKSSSMYCI